MKLELYLILPVFIISGCSMLSGSIDKQRSWTDSRVAVKADSVHYMVDTPHLSHEAVRLLSKRKTDSLANHILKQIITGFRLEQKKGTRFVEDYGRADFLLQVDTIRVSRGRLTLDFTHPGPIFSIQMKMRGWRDQRLVFMKTYKGRENLAQVVGAEKSLYWPGSNDKKRIDYQVETILEGLRPILGRGYADFLEIQQYQ